MRIAVHLLAIALVWAWATQGYAHEASHDGGATVPASPEGSGAPTPAAAAGAPKLDHQQAPKGNGESRPVAGEGGQKGNAAGGDVNPAPSAGKDSDTTDTRITVQPWAPGRRNAAKNADTKHWPFARPLFRPRRSAHESPGGVTRDAIGLPVARHDIEQGRGQQRDLPAFVSDPAAAPTGLGANTSGGHARSGGAFAHPPSNANSNVRSSTLNRGTINGTNFVRPGVGLSSVGGPAKPVAGISGTTIRPKH